MKEMNGGKNQWRNCQNLQETSSLKKQAGPPEYTVINPKFKTQEISWKF